MKCCNQNQMTRFCAHCGKKLWTDPIDSLKDHLYQHFKTAERRASSGAKCFERAANKYFEWFKALNELTAQPQRTKKGKK